MLKESLFRSHTATIKNVTVDREEGNAVQLPTRRTVLGGTAAMAAAMLSLPAQAAAPFSGTQAPGFYRYMVGSIEITVINDGVT